MAVDRWTQINELFHAVIALDSEAREAYLAEACAGDAELQQEVAHLVAGYKPAEASMPTDFLGGAIQELAQEDTLTIGQDFGPYRVIREIGRGGMGRVFVAERADQEFHRRVAIKLIKRGMDTDSVLAALQVAAATRRPITNEAEPPKPGGGSGSMPADDGSGWSSGPAGPRASYLSQYVSGEMASASNAYMPADDSAGEGTPRSNVANAANVNAAVALKNLVASKSQLR